MMFQEAAFGEMHFQTAYKLHAVIEVIYQVTKIM